MICHSEIPSLQRLQSTYIPRSRYSEAAAAVIAAAAVAGAVVAGCSAAVAVLQNPGQPEGLLDLQGLRSRLLPYGALLCLG